MKLNPDLTLSTGRIVKHSEQPDGSQLATPTPGPKEMTPAEWFEYCDRLRTMHPLKLKTSAALHAQDFNQTPGKLPVGASYSIFDQLAKEDAANPNAGIVQPFPKGRYT